MQRSPLHTTDATDVPPQHAPAGCNNADPAREEDAAREAAFPFTTITPNVGRGFIVLPDPAPLLGFTAETAQPAHGYARAFDPSQLPADLNNPGPLQQLVRDCGWGACAAGGSGDGGAAAGFLWRRVPVVVKDVAGLVPGVCACSVLCRTMLMRKLLLPAAML